jgi:hypothetical protein
VCKKPRNFDRHEASHHADKKTRARLQQTSQASCYRRKLRDTIQPCKI